MHGWCYICTNSVQFSVTLPFHLRTNRPQRPRFLLRYVFLYATGVNVKNFKVDFLENEAQYQKLLFLFPDLFTCYKSKRNSNFFLYLASFSRKSTLKFFTLRPVACMKTCLNVINQRAPSESFSFQLNRQRGAQTVAACVEFHSTPVHLGG